MRVLGLDMSNKTGYALLAETDLESQGLIVSQDLIAMDGEAQGCVEDLIFVRNAEGVAKGVKDIIKNTYPDFIYIEQTNKGKNRTSQKQLEFIHFAVLKQLIIDGYSKKIRYVDTSAWRSKLKIRMTKDDSKHNKLVKNSLARGKVTTKHLAVRWANETYGLNLLLKDNDIADAIAVATYGDLIEKEEKPNITEDDIERLFM